MIRRSVTGTAFALVFMGSTTEAQPSAEPLPGRSYKVAFWYERDRPFSTVQYRAYDLAKKQYDADAVDRWLATILEHHPRYGARVRDLSTIGEPGATQAERLENAIHREIWRWAELNRRPSRPSPDRVVPLSVLKPRGESPGRASFDRPAPGSPGVDPKRPASPFPYPYRSGPR